MGFDKLSFCRIPEWTPKKLIIFRKKYFSRFSGLITQWTRRVRKNEQKRLDDPLFRIWKFRIYVFNFCKCWKNILTFSGIPLIFFIYLNFGQKSKFWSKIEILAKNRNYGKKSKFWRKIEIFMENRNFGEKSKSCPKFWSKNVTKNEICGNFYFC